MKPLLVLRSCFLLVVVGVSLLVGLSLVGDSALVAASSLWSVGLHPVIGCLRRLGGGDA